MAPTQHPLQLLPHLPPELRNMVYQNTITEPDSSTDPSSPTTTTPTNSGLPFSKVFDSSQTSVAITPVHYGFPSLLNLLRDNILEAREYADYLHAHGTELRIGVVFKGNTQHFIQEHWDKKMLAHMKNLAKKFPWLKKVARYDVQILWAPLAQASRRKVDVGTIAAQMVKVLTGEMAEGVREKKSFVKATLHVEHYVGGEYVNAGREMRLKNFLEGVEGVAKMQTRVVKMAGRKPLRAPVFEDGEFNMPLTEAIMFKTGTRQLLVDDGGVVKWSGWTEGDLVARKELVDGEEVGVKLPASSEEWTDYWLSPVIWYTLIDECR